MLPWKLILLIYVLCIIYYIEGQVFISKGKIIIVIRNGVSEKDFSIDIYMYYSLNLELYQISNTFCKDY